MKMIKTNLEVIAELMIATEGEKQNQVLTRALSEGYKFNEIKEAVEKIDSEMK